MEVLEASPVGVEILRRRGALLIGLSIKNSYFKDRNLERLLRWASDSSEHVFIMIPDEPSVLTLQSLGYDESTAKTKARLEANRLENKCRKIIGALGITGTSVVRWNNIKENPYYRKMLAQIEALYVSDPKFRLAIRETTNEVIENHGSKLGKDEALDIGVKFLFQELALITEAANVLEQVETAYVYHKVMPVFKEMLENRFSLEIPKNVGYVVAI